MKVKKQINISKLVAAISFLIGTSIFLVYYFTSSVLLLVVGYGFIFVAIITNLVILIYNIFTAVINFNYRKKLFKICSLMLINIPVMLLYIWLVSILTGNMRVNFTNKTGQKIDEITVLGCKNIKISELKSNESKTIWIPVKGDCSISIEYLLNNEIKNEIVAGYVTNGMGKRVWHYIGNP